MSGSAMKKKVEKCYLQAEKEFNTSQVQTETARQADRGRADKRADGPVDKRTNRLTGVRAACCRIQDGKF